jgi:HK97 gp10 family phage protein
MRIEGGDKLARAFRSMATRLARQEMRAMLHKGAQPFAASIAQTAPKGDPAPPNISDVAVSNPRSSRGGGQIARVAVGPPKAAHYGYFQEYGFYNVPGKGFMRASFDSSHGRALQIIQREIWAAISERSPGGSGLL